MDAVEKKEKKGSKADRREKPRSIKFSLREFPFALLIIDPSKRFPFSSTFILPFRDLATASYGFYATVHESLSLTSIRIRISLS